MLEQIDMQSFALGAAAGATITIAIRITLNLFTSNKNNVNQSNIVSRGDVVGGNKNDSSK